ncbi:MAG: hypothetical protein ABJG41_10155 [Cyclobacteriaceae bacterium]
MIEQWSLDAEVATPPFLKKWKFIYMMVGFYQVAVLVILYLLSIAF